MPQQTFNGKEFMARVQAHPWGSDRIARKVILFAYCLCSFADFTTGKDAFPKGDTIKAHTHLHHRTIAEVKRLLVDAGFLAVVKDKNKHRYALMCPSMAASLPKSPSEAFTDKELIGLSRETAQTIRKRVDAAITAGTKAPAIRQAGKEFAGQDAPIWDVLKRAKELQGHTNARLRAARHAAADKREQDRADAIREHDRAKRAAMSPEELEADADATRKEKAERKAEWDRMFGKNESHTPQQDAAAVLQQELGAPDREEKVE